MTERQGAVTMKGNPMTLLGNELKVGDKAPDFTLTANDMSDKKLSDFGDKVKVLSVVPSIDTSVCANETRSFNQKLGKVDGVETITVSVDTPMAQKRWCAAEGVENITLLSDFKTHQFGKDYGVRIKENGLLARQVIVLDQDNTIQYIQLVKEVADEPDYDPVVAKAKALAG